MTDQRKKKKRAKHRRSRADSPMEPASADAPPAAKKDVDSETDSAKASPREEDAFAGRPRRGQIASEKARFDLGPHARVIGDALGQPPPGYGTTMISLFVRDPGHVVAVWDVNDEASLARAAERGWEPLELRVVAMDGAILARVPVGERSGVYHVALDRNGVTVTAEIGFLSAAGQIVPVARAVPVRVPSEPGGPAGSPIRVSVPPDLDRRGLLRTEGPARVGHRALPENAAPATRLVERLRLARRVPLGPPPPAVRRSGPSGAPAPASRPGRTDDDERAPHAKTGRASPSDRVRPAPPRAAGEPPRMQESGGGAAAGHGAPSAPPEPPGHERPRGAPSSGTPRSGEGRGDRGGRSGEGPRS